MKKMLLFAMCFLLLCGTATTAAAAESGIYEDAGDLYEAWVSQGQIPDYLTAVISTDGGTDNLTFGLVEGEAGEAGRQEILDLVRDDSSVTIIYQTYPLKELYRIQEEIVDAYFSQDLGLVTAGVSEGANRLLLEVKSSYAENPDTLAMIDAVTARYGDAVSFRFTDSEIQFVTITQPLGRPPHLIAPPRRNQALPPFLAVSLCALLAVAVLYVAMRGRRVIAASANGASVALETPSLSTKEVKAAIRGSDLAPPARLHARVTESIQASDKNHS